MNNDWKIKDIKQDKDIKVFSTFACGGGSSLGYKKAGFKVIGNVEIDPAVNKLYLKNCRPELNYNEDLREFNKRDDLPEVLYDLDILDGSPPCTPFSTVGARERFWGVEKQFREGQVKQTLDDLFFVFLDTVEKLRPRIVVAENVTGIIKGKAKGYVYLILQRLKELGYSAQIFQLNSAHMEVPQARHRVFIIANRMQYKPLKLVFNKQPILFGEVRSLKGKELGEKSEQIKKVLDLARPGDTSLEDTTKRTIGARGRYFSQMLVSDNQVAPVLTSGGYFIRLYDKLLFSEEDCRRVQSFPADYDFLGQNVQYVCGMSVPPNMMWNIAREIEGQWLD